MPAVRPSGSRRFVEKPFSLLLIAEIVFLRVVSAVRPIGRTSPEVDTLDGTEGQTQTLMPRVVRRAVGRERISGKGMDGVKVGTSAVRGRSVGLIVVLEKWLGPNADMPNTSFAVKRLYGDNVGQWEGGRFAHPGCYWGVKSSGLGSFRRRFYVSERTGDIPRA